MDEIAEVLAERHEACRALNLELWAILPKDAQIQVQKRLYDRWRQETRTTCELAPEVIHK